MRQSSVSHSRLQWLAGGKIDLDINDKSTKKLIEEKWK